VNHISTFFFVEAEIDSAAELIDFLRFNCHYTKSLMRHQPISVRPEETLNRLRLRSLEGFIASVTPFNFTAIAGNLAYAPAIMVRTSRGDSFFVFLLNFSRKVVDFDVVLFNKLSTVPYMFVAQTYRYGTHFPQKGEI
jgi:hypothetical protein